MRTQPEIDAEIAKLKTAMPRLNQSAREDVEAQIFVLTEKGDREFSDFHYGDETAVEYNHELHMAAVEAAQWLHGELAEAPSEGI